MLVVFARAVYVGKIFQPFFVAKTVIRCAFFHQNFRILQVFVFALALNIRSVIAADVGPFVIKQTRFLHRVENIFNAVFYKTSLIGVFYSQNKFSACFFGVEITIKRGTQPAYMQISGRAWRKPCPYLFVRHIKILFTLFFLILPTLY